MTFWFPLPKIEKLNLGGTPILPWKDRQRSEAPVHSPFFSRLLSTVHHSRFTQLPLSLP